jgi:hypothetical protein
MQSGVSSSAPSLDYLRSWFGDTRRRNPKVARPLATRINCIYVESMRNLASRLARTKALMMSSQGIG